VNAGIK